MSICVFGDSIAWGAYDPVNGGWVTLLRNYVEKNWKKFGNKSVYNLGVCGDTTEKVLGRLENELKVREPDLIIFAIGTNDASNWNLHNNPVVSPQSFRINLESLTELAEKYCQKLIWVGLTPVDELVTHPFDDENTFELKQTRTYNQIVKDHAVETKAPFVDVISTVEISDLCDGVHPNTREHKKIFEVTKLVLEHVWS